MHNTWNSGNYSVFSDGAPSYAAKTIGTSRGNRAGTSTQRNQAPPVIHKQYQLFDENPNLDIARELFKTLAFDGGTATTNVNSNVIQPSACNMIDLQANPDPLQSGGESSLPHYLKNIPAVPTILDVLMFCAEVRVNPANGPVSTFKPEYFSHFSREQLSALYKRAESILYSTLTSQSSQNEVSGTVIRQDIILENEEQSEFVISNNKHILIASFNPFAAIKMLPPLLTIAGFRPLLPLKTMESPNYTLVLDLDETLVHCTTSQPANCSYNYLIGFHDSSYMVFVNMRPYYRTFLERLSKVYEIILFTASKRSYANQIANLLDPTKKYIKHKLYREHCVSVNGNYVKNLDMLGRDLSKTVIVDNSPLAFGYHLDNGVPITSWFAEQSDKELLRLIPFLERLACVQGDVRTEIHERFDLQRLVMAN